MPVPTARCPAFRSPTRSRSWASDGAVVATPDRATWSRCRRPRPSPRARLRAAHDGGAEGTDDAALVEAAGGRVVVVAGEADNRKLTVPDDLDWARQRVAGEG